MRTETTTKTVYFYDELSNEAKESARDWYRGSSYDFVWSEEWRDSLRGFTDTFPVEVKDWCVSIDRESHITFSLSGDDFLEDMKGVRLWKYLKACYGDFKECPWTGYCGDESLLAPYREFLKRPDLYTDMESLMQDCLNSWVQEWQADMEYQVSGESVEETIKCNEYEFDEDGHIA